VEVAAGVEVPPFLVEEVRVEPMKTVAALLHDPNPIHWDVEAVQALGMGDRAINQGPSNMAYVVNMLVAWAGDPARLRRLRVRFLGNVLAGDRLAARGVVTGVREDGGERLAELDVWLERSEDDRVLDGTATVALGSSNG
jgi:acyl dehydratase